MAQHCYSRLIFQKWRPVLSYLQLHHPCYVPCATKTSRWGIWEYNMKGGYKYLDETTVEEAGLEGMKAFPEELKKWGQEFKARFTEDPMVFHRANGDFEYCWQFNGKDSLDGWVLTTDGDNLEGSSRAYLGTSPTNKALFYGYLCNKVPQDGMLTRSGYCNIRSPYNVISFKRVRPYDWSGFTHLLLRVRGDGRPYLINILMDYYFDASWNLQYNYSLFTRGGPYWQTVKIPFSKFFQTYKGRVQDKQHPLTRYTNIVKNLGITLADDVEGPFRLEIDYIGLICDHNHTEKLAYESYNSRYMTE